MHASERLPVHAACLLSARCLHAGVLLSKAGLLPLGPVPRPSVFLLRLMPGVLSFAGTLYLGNFAYLSLSMAFIQMLKAMVPAITLVCRLSSPSTVHCVLKCSVCSFCNGVCRCILIQPIQCNFCIVHHVRASACHCLHIDT